MTIIIIVIIIIIKIGLATTLIVFYGNEKLCFLCQLILTYFILGVLLFYEYFQVLEPDVSDACWTNCNKH